MALGWELQLLAATEHACLLQRVVLLREGVGLRADGPARAAARAAQDGDGLGQDLYRLTLARGLDDRALDSQRGAGAAIC